MARIYCPNCNKNKKYPIVEYQKPLANLGEVWWTSTPRKTKLKCHKCKKPVYLLLPPGIVKCPRCKKGTFDLYEPLAYGEAECFLRTRFSLP